MSQLCIKSQVPAARVNRSYESAYRQYPTRRLPRTDLAKAKSFEQFRCSIVRGILMEEIIVVGDRNAQRFAEARSAIFLGGLGGAWNPIRIASSIAVEGTLAWIVTGKPL